MRVVFDTNTLVSAILKPDSLAMQALKLALKKGVVIFSDETKAEIRDVIQRPKFDVYAPLKIRTETLEKIIENSLSIDIETTDNIICRATSDIKFLRLA